LVVSCAGTVQYGVPAHLLTVTHGRNIIKSELGKMDLICCFIPTMLSKYGKKYQKKKFLTRKDRAGHFQLYLVPRSVSALVSRQKNNARLWC
jgi:hypothetical protein